MARMSFAEQVAVFAKHTNSSIDETGRAIALELFGAVIKDTPVDTGRAKGNWQTTMNSPASHEIARDGEQEALSELSSVAPMFMAGSVIYLTNNLPYIWSLEYGGYGRGPGATEKTTRDGYSIQAPYGMVRKNVARIRGRIGRIARKYRV